MAVTNFHPNIIYANLANPEAYRDARAFYHDPGRLLATRGTAPGPRDLLQRILDLVVAAELPTATLGEVSAAWRARHPAPWP